MAATLAVGLLAMLGAFVAAIYITVHPSRRSRLRCSSKEDCEMSEEVRVLIIEDDPDAAEAMKVILEAQGWQVTTTSDPARGFELAKATKPGVIVLDVMFGARDATKGFDYAVKMKQNGQLAPIPILMVTAVNIRQPGFGFRPEKDGEYLPVDDFIEKPAEPRELAEKVRRLLAQGTSRWKDWPEKAD
jgi:DNA-binding response OmpR family regulator